MEPFRTLLVTTDFSEISTLAFAPARMLARTFGARIVVLYVQEEILPPFVGEYAQTSLQGILDDQRGRLEQELARFAQTHVGADIAIETIVGTGIPHVEIGRVAQEHKADLIVLATHGRGFLGHAIFGSTAERVLRRATCPVLTVRPPE